MLSKLKHCSKNSEKIKILKKYINIQKNLQPYFVMLMFL
jgi:hypothetical protein